MLVALPQSPETRRPDRTPDIARRARDRVLDRMTLAGLVPADEIASAKTDIVPLARLPMPAFAPHAADQALGRHAGRNPIRLTIEAPLQKNLETLARERARALGPDISVAIVALDNASGEIRARVASSDYFDEARAGQVDMSQALRSPGSALKPFIYGVAFEDGLVHPESLIEDRPTRYGNYAPENFDQTYPGHRHGAARVADVAQRPRGRAARQGRRQPPHHAACASRRAARIAQGGSAGSGDGARRRRREAHRPDHAL